MTSQAKQREVRLGIVLYGGVSLAVYENGVAQELFRAVKGEGVYSLIKDLVDSDIVVDIMSGTSAGGINGILLGYALANSRDFKACSKLWREDGDILRLLRTPGKPNANSILDSRDYYQPRLEAAFTGMPPYLAPGGDGVPQDLRIISEVPELDVFVTGTDVQGSISTVFDEAGHPIDIKNHRQIFRLSYRDNRKNEFKPANSVSLAKLARITSCFPVAFEPVDVTPQTDSTLQRWGKLDDRKTIYYLDGGVLNNKPFTSTIDAIARRTADREVTRMLLYVEPDPERFQPVSSPVVPNVVRAAGDALIGIPGYQSIASDLEAIAAHNDRIQQLQDILNLEDCLPAATGGDCFQTPKADGGLEFIAEKATRCMYEAWRFAQLRDRAVEGILNDGYTRRLMRDAGQRHAARILVQSFEQWRGNNSEMLGDFDVYFRMRRLMHLSDWIMYRLYPSTSAPRKFEIHAEEYRSLWRRLNHQFKLLEEIEYAMETAIDKAPFPWEKLKDAKATADHANAIWQQAETVLRAVLDTRDVELKAGLGEDSDAGPDMEKKERKNLIDHLRERIPGIITKAGKPAGNLLHRCDELERQILLRFVPKREDDPVTREYCRFVRIDCWRFPVQRAADIPSLNQIRTVRISPIDAQRGYSARTLNEKLCGNELGHFGGFMKRSWRANDTMWGRLDAVCQLVECLITPERFDQLPNGFTKALMRWNLCRLFPNSSESLRQEIREAARDLSTTRTVDGKYPSFERFWEALIRAAQIEILTDEVPRVIDAAIRQQADWNEYEVVNPKGKLISDRQVWAVGPRRLDAAIASYASAQLAAETVPAPGLWAAHFESVYDVGSESWNRDIPKPIMTEIMANAALVLRDCLLGIAGPNAPKIKNSLPYRFGVSLPLFTTYKLVQIQRTAPEYVWVTLVSGLVLSIGMLLVEFPLRTTIFPNSELPSWTWRLSPVALIALIVVVILLRNLPERESEKESRNVRAALLRHIGEGGLGECLCLNDAPRQALYPGTILPGENHSSQPPVPRLTFGDVEEFRARQRLNGAFRKKMIENLFGGALDPAFVKRAVLEVRRLRRIRFADRAEWLRANAAAIENRAIAAESYEGTVTLAISLRTPTKADERELSQELGRKELGRGFLLLSLSEDRTEMVIVSEAPVVFAYCTLPGGAGPGDRSRKSPAIGISARFWRFRTGNTTKRA